MKTIAEVIGVSGSDLRGALAAAFAESDRSAAFTGLGAPAQIRRRSPNWRPAATGRLRHSPITPKSSPFQR
jgi:hypothetical protein